MPGLSTVGQATRVQGDGHTEGSRLPAVTSALGTHRHLAGHLRVQEETLDEATVLGSTEEETGGSARDREAVWAPVPRPSLFFTVCPGHWAHPWWSWNSQGSAMSKASLTRPIFQPAQVFNTLTSLEALERKSWEPSEQEGKNPKPQSQPGSCSAGVGDTPAHGRPGHSVRLQGWGKRDKKPSTARLTTAARDGRELP